MNIGATVEELLSDENMHQAIEFLRRKKNSCGDDGIWLHDLENYWKLNQDKIKRQIIDGTYQPQIVHERIIINASGKHRNINLFSSIDRMVSRALLQILQKSLGEQLSSYSFAYQSGKGIDDAVAYAAECIESGKNYVVKIDIKDFFDSIPHDRLLKILKDTIKDERLYFLLEKLIVCTVESDYRLCQKTKGILQGNHVSPLLSNVYMAEFDAWMERQGYSFVRFADDINVYVEEIRDGYRIYEDVERKLSEYGLEINKEKKGIVSAFSTPYLGYQFEKHGDMVLVKRQKRNSKTIWMRWQKESVEKVNQEYHLINDGILTRKDFSILFQNEDKKVHIPVEVTDSISIYSDIELNSNFLDVLSRYKLNLNVYNRYGIYLGSFYPNNQRNRMKCLVQQAVIYQNPKRRLEYAKKIKRAVV